MPSGCATTFPSPLSGSGAGTARDARTTDIFADRICTTNTLREPTKVASDTECTRLATRLLLRSRMFLGHVLRPLGVALREHSRDVISGAADVVGA